MLSAEYPPMDDAGGFGFGAVPAHEAATLHHAFSLYGGGGHSSSPPRAAVGAGVA
jgi:hypothetical protein